jgi:hypothetical protein
MIRGRFRRSAISNGVQFLTAGALVLADLAIDHFASETDHLLADLRIGQQVPRVEPHRADQIVGVAERVLRVEVDGTGFQHVAGEALGAFTTLDVPGIRYHGIPLCRVGVVGDVAAVLGGVAATTPQAPQGPVGKSR